MTKEEKADALLAGRRVNIILANKRGIWATVRGDSGSYHCKLERERGKIVAWCDCEYSANFHPVKCDCSHTEALRKIWTGGGA